MEGNFRILQAADNEFIIQKEKCETITVGTPFNGLFDNKEDYVFESMDVAASVLSSIKKYPVVVYQDK